MFKLLNILFLRLFKKYRVTSSLMLVLLFLVCHLSFKRYSKMTLQKTIIAAALLAALTGCSGKNNDELTNSNRAHDNQFKLKIAHINDTHSHIDPVKASFTMGKNGVRIYNEFGGYPRVLEAANEIKEKATKDHQPLLFLHGGDAWQGTAYFKLYQGAANADILSQMGLDAMTIGNHEFDIGTVKLAEFIDEVSFPVLANNINTANDPALNGIHNLKPYQLFAFKNDEKRKIASVDNANSDEQVVAVIGVVLDDLPNISTGTGDVAFENEITKTQQTVDELTAMGVNKILVLSHIGNAREINLAKNTHGIDAIIGGHSHTLLGDFTDLGYGNNGQYAELVDWKNKQGKTCIVQAGQYAQAIGEVNLDFDAKGELESCSGHNTLLSNSVFYSSAKRNVSSLLTGGDYQEVQQYIESNKKIKEVSEDSTLRAYIDADYKPGVDKAYGKTVAEVPKEIIHVRRPKDKGSDNHGSDVAPLIGESMVYWANTPAVQAVINKHVDIGLLGAGGVRTNISLGDFKEGNAFLELMPFSNFLSVFTVKGKVIDNLLTSTIDAVLPEGSHAGKFPYVGGMRYTFKEKVKHHSGYITQLQINKGSEASPQWENIQPNEDYVIAVNNYNASGNDGWTELAKAQLTATDRLDIVKNADGSYKAYQVDRLEKKGDKYIVVYKNNVAPNCIKKNSDGSFTGVDVCDTDAQSFIDYAEQVKELKPLTFETVTMDYLP